MDKETKQEDEKVIKISSKYSLKNKKKNVSCDDGLVPTFAVKVATFTNCAPD